MAKRITELPAAAAAALTQLLEIVNDPSGSPVSQKLSLSQLVVVTGAATNGGTGQAAVTTGDLLYGSAANTWSRLADVATGNALISGGVSTAPSWGKVGLATHVSGELPVANGGTGSFSLGSGRILFGDGTNPVGTNSGLTYNSGTAVLTNLGNVVFNNGDLSFSTSPVGGVGGTPAVIVTNVTPGPLYSGLYFQNTIARQTAFAFATNTSGVLNNNYSMGVDMADTGANNFFLFDVVNGGPAFLIDSSRRLGLRGVTTITGILHIPGSDGNTGMAPIKLDAGALLSTEEAGALDYNGDGLYFTLNDAVRREILMASAVTTETVISDTTVTIVVGTTTYKLLAIA